MMKPNQIANPNQSTVIFLSHQTTSFLTFFFFFFLIYFFFLILYRTSCFRTGFQYPFQYLLWNPKFLKILGDQSNILIFFIFSCHPRVRSWQRNTLLWYSYSKITKIILIQVSVAWSCSWLHSVSYSLAIKENHTLWYLILGWGEGDMYTWTCTYDHTLSCSSP